MRTRKSIAGFGLSVIALTWPVTIIWGQLLDTVFTYQGRLRNIQNDFAQEVTSTCDFEVKLCESGDTMVACSLGLQNLPGQPVTGSIFALELDFQANVFDGNDRWLEIAVKCSLPPYNDTAYAVLPRQRITAAPYALQTRGIFVNETGEVGIGTTTPVGRLTIKHTNHNAMRLERDTLETWSIGLTTNGESGLNFSNESDAGESRMFIGQSGNVAMGTQSPLDNLHIADAGEPGIMLEKTAVAKWNMKVENDGNWRLQDRTNTPTNVITANLQGRVGIGTPSPDAKLSVEDNFKLSDYDNSTAPNGTPFFTLKTGSSHTNGHFPFLEWLDAAGTRAMYMGWGQSGSYIEQTLENGNNLAILGGRVGIGTTTPATRFHVNDGVGNAGDGGSIGFGSTGGPMATIRGSLVFNPGGSEQGDLVFSTRPVSGTPTNLAERMRITSGGEIGIGTSAPSSELHIASDVEPGMRLQKTAGSTANWDVKVESDGTFRIIDQTGTPANAITIDQNERVGISTSSPTSRLHVQSGSTTNPMAFFEGTTAGNQFVRVANTVSHVHVGIGSTGATSGDGYLFSASDDLFFGVDGTPSVFIEGMSSAASTSGFVGIGTTNPTHRLHVANAVVGTAEELGNHVALIENVAADNPTDHADVLALRINNSDPRGNNNFITFFDSNSCIGEIQGTDAGGGINFKSTPCDYAEFLQRVETGELIEAGDVVGVFAGKVTRLTAGADSTMVISTSPLILGNMPENKAAESQYEKVAFIGQVPIKIRGKARAGDFIVPSGNNDGIGVAVSLDEIMPEQIAQVVGQAWESSDDPGVKKVNALVGVSPAASGSARIVDLVQRQSQRIRLLEEQLANLEAKQGEFNEVNTRLARLEAVLARHADSGRKADEFKPANDSPLAQPASGGGR